MSSPWYLWPALLALLVLFFWDCGVFVRNARRAEFSLLAVVVMFAELVGVAVIIGKGVSS